MILEANERSEKRSDNCLKLLQDRAKAISTGVSYERFHEIAPVLGKENLYEHFQNLIMGSITRGTNYGFEQLTIAEKMEELDNLANNCPEDVVAWRPVTGNADIKAIKHFGLSMRRLSLKKKLAALDKENEYLKELIIEKRTLLQKKKEELAKLLF